MRTSNYAPAPTLETFLQQAAAMTGPQAQRLLDMDGWDDDQWDFPFAEASIRDRAAAGPPRRRRPRSHRAKRRAAAP